MADVRSILEGTDGLKAEIRTAWTRTSMSSSKSLLAQVNWFHLLLLTLTPLAVLSALFFVPVHIATLGFAVFWYFCSGMGITAGYHRLWSHRAWDAHPVVETLLAIFGAAALEGSAKWWCRNHRAHHRYVDTNKDPYNATRGFFYAHVGWLLVKQDPNEIGRVNVADLSSNAIIDWQHRYYLPLSLFFAFGFPALVCGLWDDAWGGFFYAGIGRAVFVHHATFFVNSLAHYFGDKPYSDAHTAYDSIITAFLSLGEGYHNFHHSFPNDFRNGILWWAYDPTKWLIRGLARLGLASNLKRFDATVLDRARLEMTMKNRMANNEEVRDVEKKIDALKKRAHKVAPGKMPIMTRSEMDARVQQGEKLMIVDGFVVDVHEWAEMHPGGEQVVYAYVGKDATREFHGEVYKHSTIAMQVIESIRIAAVA
eukprot:ANDGO_04198.mRNA.1 Acyl-CoA desaturase